MVVFDGILSVPAEPSVIVPESPEANVMLPAPLLPAAASASRREQIEEAGELATGQFEGVAVGGSLSAVTTNPGCGANLAVMLSGAFMVIVVLALFVLAISELPVQPVK
jgi:hypothetical protein